MGVSIGAGYAVVVDARRGEARGVEDRDGRVG